MKRFAILIICTMLYASNMSAQQKFNLQATVKEKFTVNGYFTTERLKLEPGERVTLQKVFKDDYAGGMYIIETKGHAWVLKEKELDKLNFDKPDDVFAAWQLSAVFSGFYTHLITRGMEYELRGELDDYCINFINSVMDNNLVFEDDYVTDYVQSLLYRVHPGPLRDRRPGTLNLLILKNNVPNAFSLPNGTVMVTTGMLSLITSEDELLGVLAHEAAHFVLDHHVINISDRIEEEERARRRAEFWAGFATMMAAASEAYLAIEHDIYLGGSLTYSTAMLSCSIANEIAGSIGINYNHEQELEADQAAYSILEYIGSDPVAYAAVLKKLQAYNIETGNMRGNLASYSHPKISSRIQYGEADVSMYYDADYQVKISFINTFNARYEFYAQHYSECATLVDRNISAGIATEMDYLLKTMVTRICYDTPAKNREALGYLEIARSLNVVPNINLAKQEGITYLRLNEKTNAIQAFTEYKDQLMDKLDNLNNVHSSGMWTRIYFETLNELDWVNKMLYKIDKI